LNDVKFDVVQLIGTTIGQQRCEGVTHGSKDFNLVDQGKLKYEKEFDYYLALDADIGFKIEDIQKLISLDKDIVGGAYVSRADLSKYVTGHFVEKEKYTTLSRHIPVMAKGLIKVDWIGMGFTLIKRDVFRKIQYPWWRESIVKTVENGKEYAHYNTDDIGFCILAKEAGYEIYCDCDTVVNHHI